MMKFILAAMLVMLIAFASFYWVVGKRDYQSAPFWRASDESNNAVVDHSVWQEILDEHLIGDDASGVNLVDYQSIKDEAQQDLDGYIAYLTSLDPRKYRRLEQFAYWVNLYNALTVSVILQNYPIESITKISKKTLAFGPWDDVVTSISGTEVTLNDIEHRILRANWDDHRIHFAVNCASYGCPNLQDLAFTSDNTQALLSSAAHDFVGHTRGVAVGKEGLVLSSIFDWYQEDFGTNEAEMLETISVYLQDDQLENFRAQANNISYQYDWSLNDGE